jgi:hypothetical protein
VPERVQALVWQVATKFPASRTISMITPCLLQKAKAECEVLGLNKSILHTRIWNKATSETFESAWEDRKQK